MHVTEQDGSTVNAPSYYRILTMVYNFQRYWGFGLYPSSN
jgi:hypothetical protein